MQMELCSNLQTKSCTEVAMFSFDAEEALFVMGGTTVTVLLWGNALSTAEVASGRGCMGAC